MTKDQERKVAAKQLLCARYTTKIQDRLRNIDERLIDYYDDMVRLVSRSTPSQSLARLCLSMLRYVRREKEMIHMR